MTKSATPGLLIDGPVDGLWNRVGDLVSNRVWHQAESFIIHPVRERVWNNIVRDNVLKALREIGNA